jgi:hypothetical protein
MTAFKNTNKVILCRTEEAIPDIVSGDPVAGSAGSMPDGGALATEDHTAVTCPKCLSLLSKGDKARQEGQEESNDSRHAITRDKAGSVR